MRLWLLIGLLLFCGCDICLKSSCNTSDMVRLSDRLEYHQVIGKYQRNATWILQNTNGTDSLIITSYGFDERFEAKCGSCDNCECERFNEAEVYMEVPGAGLLHLKMNEQSILLTTTQDCPGGVAGDKCSCSLELDDIRPEKARLFVNRGSCPSIPKVTKTIAPTPLANFNDVIRLTQFGAYDMLNWSMTNGPVRLTLNNQSYALVDFYLP